MLLVSLLHTSEYEIVCFSLNACAVCKHTKLSALDALFVTVTTGTLIIRITKREKVTDKEMDVTSKPRFFLAQQIMFTVRN